MMVTYISYNTIFTQGYNNYYYYGTICHIYAKSLNAFINICKYLHKFASCICGLAASRRNRNASRSVKIMGF